jgi:hypothetical protein
VDFSEARDLFGIIFQIPRPNYKIMDYGLIFTNGRGLAACSGEMIDARWVKVVAVEASASGRSDVGLERSVATSKTEGAALALASMASSSRVT